MFNVQTKAKQKSAEKRLSKVELNLGHALELESLRAALDKADAQRKEAQGQVAGARREKQVSWSGPRPERGKRSRPSHEPCCQR